MVTATKTLKLPFLDLNKTKKKLFFKVQELNTELANAILVMPKEVKAKLTTRSFKDSFIGSAWINQTIRNAKAKTKAKRFKCLPLETNNQNWQLNKVGDTYSVKFNITRDRANRVPLDVHEANHKDILDKIISGEAKQGTLKLYCSKKGIWYTCISVSWDVPDAKDTKRYVGVDRGQNCIAVAVTPEGKNRFFKAGEVKVMRRKYQSLRKTLQEQGKHKAVKALEQKESRRMRHINHCIAKDIVAFAVENDCGIILEDLSGIRKDAKQRKKTKSDAASNRDKWAYFDLENKIMYKAKLAGIYAGKRPPQYTSRSCSRCGYLGNRKKHEFKCPKCGYECHADWNAGKNLSQWDGWTCSVGLEIPFSVMDEGVQQDGADERPPNLVSEGVPSGTLE